MLYPHCFVNFQTCQGMQGQCNVHNGSCVLCVGFNKTSYSVDTAQECRNTCGDVFVDLINREEMEGKNEPCHEKTFFLHLCENKGLQRSCSAHLFSLHGW